MSPKLRFLAVSVFVPIVCGTLFVHRAVMQSAPVVETNVLVPMRDGVRLAADVYRPPAPGKYPVMLSRTPYNKNGQAALAKFFVENNYDVRKLMVLITGSRVYQTAATPNATNEKDERNFSRAYFKRPDAEVLLMAGSYDEDVALLRRLRVRPAVIAAGAAGLSMFASEIE